MRGCSVMNHVLYIVNGQNIRNHLLIFRVESKFVLFFLLVVAYLDDLVCTIETTFNLS